MFFNNKVSTQNTLMSNKYQYDYASKSIGFNVDFNI